MCFFGIAVRVAKMRRILLSPAFSISMPEPVFISLIRLHYFMRIVYICMTYITFLPNIISRK